MFLQRRQHRLGLRQCGLLRRDVGPRDLTELKLAVQDVEPLAVGLDDLLGSRDLPPQRGFLDRGGDDVRGQGQVGRCELEPLRFGLATRDSICLRVPPNTSGVYETVTWGVKRL